MNKKTILICGFPNTVMRIFIEHLNEYYKIFFISYSKKFQYPKIKNILGEKAYLVDSENSKGILNTIYNLFKLISLSFKIILHNDIEIFIAYHNHFIKNGLLIWFVDLLFPRVTKVYFPYDILYYAAPKEFRYSVKNPFSFFFDKLCFEKSDKIITKGSEDELIYLKGAYRIHGKPHLAFNFLIEQKDVIDKTSDIIDLKDRKKIHLVSIGGVKNPVSGDNNYIVFKELLKEKRIVLHVYSHTSDILDELKENNENLIIHEYILDHNKFIREIAKYDFGISISKPLKYDFLQAKMASGIRIYDYLSAGIPIIVDNKHTLVADIITSNNFGIVVPLTEVGDIMKYIDNCDYLSLLASIRENRKKFFIENRINELISFLNQ